jgi:glutamine amidotransferase
MARTLRRVRAEMDGAGIDEPLRFTAAMTDGDTLIAYRWACDGRPPSLYYRDGDAGLVVVSEPIDGDEGAWREVPKGCALVASNGRLELVPLSDGYAKLAA